MRLRCKVRDEKSNKSVGILERKPNEWFVVYDPITDSDLNIINDQVMSRITSPIQSTCQRLLKEYVGSGDGLRKMIKSTACSTDDHAECLGKHLCDCECHGANTANATQVGGDHYVKHGDFQPWDAWWHWKLNAFQGAIIKYVVRYRDKGGVEDLKKARHYIDKLIELEEGECKKST